MNLSEDELERYARRIALRSGELAGDLYVEVVVETPVNLSKQQKDLLRAFEAASLSGSHPESESFFAKVKEFWTANAKN